MYPDHIREADMALEVGRVFYVEKKNSCIQ